MTETSGDPTITHGDDDEWIAATLTRIDAALAAVDKRLDHLDDLAHRIDQALQPLRDHPEAVAKGLSLLDPGAGVRKFMTGRSNKKREAHG
jgi:hypothetical protein